MMVTPLSSPIGENYILLPNSSPVGTGELAARRVIVETENPNHSTLYKIFSFVMWIICTVSAFIYSLAGRVWEVISGTFRSTESTLILNTLTYLGEGNEPSDEVVATLHKVLKEEDFLNLYSKFLQESKALRIKNHTLLENQEAYVEVDDEDAGASYNAYAQIILNLSGKFHKAINGEELNCFSSMVSEILLCATNINTQMATDSLLTIIPFIENRVTEYEYFDNILNNTQKINSRFSRYISNRVQKLSENEEKREELRRAFRAGYIDSSITGSALLCRSTWDYDPTLVDQQFKRTIGLINKKTGKIVERAIVLDLNDLALKLSKNELNALFTCLYIHATAPKSEGESRLESRLEEHFSDQSLRNTLKAKVIEFSQSLDRDFLKNMMDMHSSQDSDQFLW